MSTLAPISVALVLFASAASAGENATPLQGAPPLPACLSYKTQVRGSVGYDHLVLITSACQKVAQCAVSTDVNPAVIAISVAPGATETVLTFRGSPAREFTARVVCSLGGK